MGRILLGLFLIAVGGAVIYYHNQLYTLFGDIDRAEKSIGESKVVYVLVGCAVIIVGVLVMIGVGPSDPMDTTQMQLGGQE